MTKSKIEAGKGHQTNSTILVSKGICSQLYQLKVSGRKPGNSTLCNEKLLRGSRYMPGLGIIFSNAPFHFQKCFMFWKGNVMTTLVLENFEDRGRVNWNRY